MRAPRAPCGGNAALPGSRSEPPAQRRVPVDVLVEQVAEPTVPAGVASLRAEGAEPQEVAGLDHDPVAVKLVDALAPENVEAVLHYVGLHERDLGARIEV